MKTKSMSIIIGAVATCATLSQSNAAITITLAEAWSNKDGVLTPASGLLDLEGLGTINLSVTGVGSHFLGLFVDHEVTETLNTFSNEYGGTSGVLDAGQSWEIDEPGWAFIGDIYDNLLASDNLTGSALDNTNGVPFGTPDDVSMALGWDVSLLAGQTAVATFTLSKVEPTGFYLSQTDPDSQATIYFSSSLDIRPTSNNVPDGGWTFVMLGASLTLMGAARRFQASQT